jgi:hypothetical protein
VTDLARALLDEIAADPAALEQLRGLLEASEVTSPPIPAYTVATLAVEIGRTERSIRAAIARGKLAAVKRGRGYMIAGDAVTEWARGPDAKARRTSPGRPTRPRRAGLSREALRRPCADGPYSCRHYQKEAERR